MHASVYDKKPTRSPKDRKEVLIKRQEVSRTEKKDIRCCIVNKYTNKNKLGKYTKEEGGLLFYLLIQARKYRTNVHNFP